MHQGRHRRRRRHGLGQPAMQGHLRGLRQSRDDQQHRQHDGLGRPGVGGGLCGDVVDVCGAEGDDRQDRADDEGDVADQQRTQGPARCRLCRRPPAPMPDQAGQDDAGRQPGDRQQHDMIGRHHGQDGRRQQPDVPEEPAGIGVAVHVAHRERVDGHADPGGQQDDHRGQPVELEPVAGDRDTGEHGDRQACRQECRESLRVEANAGDGRLRCPRPVPGDQGTG